MQTTAQKKQKKTHSRSQSSDALTSKFPIFNFLAFFFVVLSQNGLFSFTFYLLLCFVFI